MVPASQAGGRGHVRTRAVRTWPPGRLCHQGNWTATTRVAVATVRAATGTMIVTVARRGRWVDRGAHLYGCPPADVQPCRSSTRLPTRGAGLTSSWSAEGSATGLPRYHGAPVRTVGFSGGSRSPPPGAHQNHRGFMTARATCARPNLRLPHVSSARLAGADQNPRPLPHRRAQRPLAGVRAGRSGRGSGGRVRGEQTAALRFLAYQGAEHIGGGHPVGGRGQ